MFTRVFWPTSPWVLHVVATLPRPTVRGDLLFISPLFVFMSYFFGKSLLMLTISTWLQTDLSSVLRLRWKSEGTITSMVMVVCNICLCGLYIFLYCAIKFNWYQRQNLIEPQHSTWRFQPLWESFSSVSLTTRDAPIRALMLLRIVGRGSSCTLQPHVLELSSLIFQS